MKFYYLFFFSCRRRLTICALVTEVQTCALPIYFIGVGLELGGKDPAYVRADADLGFAVENTVDGAFFNSGQSCCGIERIYVHESLYKPFVERSEEHTSELQSLMRISYAVFCLKTHTHTLHTNHITTNTSL